MSFTLPFRSACGAEAPRPFLVQLVVGVEGTGKVAAAAGANAGVGSVWPWTGGTKTLETARFTPPELAFVELGPRQNMLAAVTFNLVSQIGWGGTKTLETARFSLPELA